MNVSADERIQAVKDFVGSLSAEQLEALQRVLLMASATYTPGVYYDMTFAVSARERAEGA